MVVSGDNWFFHYENDHVSNVREGGHRFIKFRICVQQNVTVDLPHFWIETFFNKQ